MNNKAPFAVLVTIVLVFTSASVAIVTCQNNTDTPSDLTATAVRINQYGGVELDLMIDKMYDAGYEPWDRLKISWDDRTAYAIFSPRLHGVYLFEYAVSGTPHGTTELVHWFVYNTLKPGHVVHISYAGESHRDQELPQFCKGPCERKDWMSDEDYGNFRDISKLWGSEGRMYRSMSPLLDNDRSRAADEAAESHSVKYIFDMCQNPSKIQYKINTGLISGYAVDLFEKGDVYAEFLSSMIFLDTEYARVFQNIADHEGPYLVCCTLGTDRTGFISLLIEALMGVSLSDITTDYNRSYKCLYDVRDDTLEYFILQKEMIGLFAVLHCPELIHHTEEIDVFKIDISDYDIQQDAENFLKNHLDLSDETIEKIKTNLSG